MTIAVRADLNMGKFSFNCEEGFVVGWGRYGEGNWRDVEVWNWKGYLESQLDITN